MKPLAPLLAIPVLALLASCRPPAPGPGATDTADTRVALAFLEAYGRRDLDGMMRLLTEDAVFRGSGKDLSKAELRAYFQGTFRKHPGLRVEVGALTVVQGTIHVRVTVQTDAIWTDTWIFEMRDHRIRAYSLASRRR
jgi:ketosteroid isomerase-like protein